MLQHKPAVQPGKGINGLAQAVMQLMDDPQTVYLMAAVAGEVTNCSPVALEAQLQQYFEGRSVSRSRVCGSCGVQEGLYRVCLCTPVGSSRLLAVTLQS